jgi:hypothetical protein
MTPDLSIVIVAWNVRDLLQACLKSIMGSAASLSQEIIVVDNASADGTPDMLRSSFRNVLLIEPGRNTGFSGGNNLGLAASQGRYILLLNPDTIVLDSAVADLAHYLDTHPSVGVVGPQLLNDNGSVQSSRRRFPTFWTAIFESTWLQQVAPKRILNRYYMLDCPDDENCEVDWLQGSALMVRREVFEQVGGFDEGYFMYSEELDWQRRIKTAGWDIVYNPAARIIHYGGKSSTQVEALKHIYFQTSKIRYFRIYHGEAPARVLRLYLLGHYGLQFLLEAGKWGIGHKRQLRRQRLRAYWQVLLSRLR